MKTIEEMLQELWPVWVERAARLHITLECSKRTYVGDIDLVVVRAVWRLGSLKLSKEASYPVQSVYADEVDREYFNRFMHRTILDVADSVLTVEV